MIISKEGTNVAISKRKKEPKADLHVTVNPLLVEYFEALRPIHGREYSEFVEEKLLALISEIAPEKILEMQLEAAEKKVLDLKQAIIEVKLLNTIDTEKQKANNEITKLQEEEQSKLKTHRENMFKKYFRTLKFQNENKIPHDWSKIQEDFRFKTKFEAQDYINNMMVGIA